MIIRGHATAADDADIISVGSRSGQLLDDG